jgi:hypothetical protein
MQDCPSSVASNCCSTVQSGAWRRRGGTSPAAFRIQSRIIRPPGLGSYPMATSLSGSAVEASCCTRPTGAPVRSAGRRSQWGCPDRDCCQCQLWRLLAWPPAASAAPRHTSGLRSLRPAPMCRPQVTASDRSSGLGPHRTEPPDVRAAGLECAQQGGCGGEHERRCRRRPQMVAGVLEQTCPCSTIV